MKQISLKEKSYIYIKERILSGEFPPSSYLVEKDLIDEIGASRTPIRESLNKLEQEQLVQIIPKKGVLVKPISLKNIVDLFQLRQIIEVTSIRDYHNNISKEELKKFRDAFNDDSNYTDYFYTLDNEFHKLIVSACDNDLVSNMMNEINMLNQRVRVLTANTLQLDFRITIDEHNAIIDNLLNDNIDESISALTSHIDKSKERTINAILKNQ